MRRGYIVIFIFLLFLHSGFAFSLKDVFTDPRKFDGKEVVFQGEVIEECLKGEGGLWLNIKTKDIFVGVFVHDKKLIAPIKFFGSYRYKGDIVRIKGVFNNYCSQHKERDIHLSQLWVIKRGELRDISVLPYKKKLFIVVFIICLTLSIFYFIKIHYVRKT